MLRRPLVLDNGRVAELPDGHSLAGVASGVLLPEQSFFAIGPCGQSEFVLSGEPVNNVALVSLNGVLQHDYICVAQTVVIDPPAEPLDDVMITWWRYA